MPVVQTHVDKYLKWLPAFVLLTSRKFGLETTHSSGRQAALLAISTLLMKSATQGLKHSVHRNRPLFPLDGQSFPSSHSATAFTGAELLRQETQRRYPVLSWAGYVPALATAGLRLSKRRHWPSDVLAGALIGVGSVWMARKLLERTWKRMEETPEDKKHASC